MDLFFVWDRYHTSQHKHLVLRRHAFLVLVCIELFAMCRHSIVKNAQAHAKNFAHTLAAQTNRTNLRTGLRTGLRTNLRTNSARESL